jgi:hypothetical protein
MGISGFVLHQSVLGRGAVPLVTDPAEAVRRALDEERVRFYSALVLNLLNDAAHRGKVTMMKGYQYQSDFVKSIVAETRAADVLTAFRVRGIPVPDAERERILAQRDPELLQRWFKRAIVATMLFREMTKGQRRRLRDLAALAHERELSAELGKLEAEFARWRAGELDAFELNERIHAFHQGPSRALYSRYTSVDPDINVAWALVEGILIEADVGAEMIDLLSKHVGFFREQKRRP